MIELKEPSPPRALSPAAALAVCLAIAGSFWGYWTLFPKLTAISDGNDVLFLLDGARRIAAGEMPHVDFSLPTGVLPYLNYLGAERLFPQFSSYMGAHLIGFLLLSPILVVAMARMPKATAALALAGVVAIAALVPSNIRGGDGYGLVFNASYNRLGAALSLAYLAWLFRAGRSLSWANGLVVAYAALFAFFLKIVLVGVIIGPLVVLAALDKGWRRAGMLSLAIAGATLFILELAGAPIGAYIADIHTMSRVNAGMVPHLFATFIFRTLFQQLLIAALVLWLLLERWHASQGASSISQQLAGVAEPLAMLAAIVTITAAESQSTGGLELTSALGLLFAPGLIGRPVQLPRLTMLAAGVSLLAGPLVIRTFENTTAVLLQREGKPVAVSWVTRYLPHTLIPEPMMRQAAATAGLWEQDNIRDALQKVGPDRINLSAPRLFLTQWVSVDHALQRIPHEEISRLGAVMTLANVDLFGLALGAEPVKGIKVVHDVGRTIQPLTDAEARAYLAKADTVFQPTCLIDRVQGFEPMSPWFTAALQAEFLPHVLTPCWTMYRRIAAGG